MQETIEAAPTNQIDDVCVHDDDTNQHQTSPKRNSQTTPPSKPDLQIIGAGLMRTGTTSLKVALEQVYQKPCYHMSNVVFQFKQSHIKLWIELFERTRDSANSSQSVLIEYLERLFVGFQMTVDYPTCAFYRELIELYPNAKVILTMRDPDQWTDSVLATMASQAMRRKPTPGERIIYTYRGVKDLWHLHKLMFTRTLGPNFLTMTRDQLKQSYIRWNEEVMRNVPADRLLIFNPHQGWFPLCQFLELPVPDSQLTFPHLNTRTDMIEALNRYQIPGRILDCLLASLFVVFLSWILLYR